MEQLTSEQCKALYFDELAIKEAPRQVYRLNGHHDGRYYYTFDQSGEPTFHISVTTMIKKTTPTSPHLIKWIAEKGVDEAKRYAQMRADYGTLMHIMFSRYLIQREIHLGDELSFEVEGYLQEKKQPLELHGAWCQELRKDIMAFAQFVKDYNVTPLMIEVVLANDESKLAGALDLVCEMDLELIGLDHENPYKSGPRKGEPREVKVKQRVKAIVDNKSGKKGFYEDNEIQLGGYQHLLVENFPEFKDEDIYLFNFAPNDWRDRPTYKLKDQTESKNIAKLQHLLELGKIELSKMKNTELIIDGVLNMEDDLENNYQHVSIYEMAKQEQIKRD